MARIGVKYCKQAFKTFLFLLMFSSVYSSIEEVHQNTASFYSDPQLEKAQDTCKDTKKCVVSSIVWITNSLVLYFCHEFNFLSIHAECRPKWPPFLLGLWEKLQ